jgi:hypothetical protein
MMKFALLIFTALSIFLMTNQTHAQTAKELAEIWDKNHISIIPPSAVKHLHLKTYLDGLKKNGVKIEEVGRSFEDREIFQMEFGTGKTKIFMWSQMHGNEPTATTALIDMFHYLQKNRDKDWVKKLSETLTIRAVPMLNPDGAEVFKRRNSQDIDINRDAVALETPEGRLLKKLRDDWQPEIGFNLHNQNIWTSVGDTTKQAAISFLVVLGNAEGKSNDAQERNKRLTSLMVSALNQFIEGNIARYDEDFNPIAFGDNFSAWGTPTILIETGGLNSKNKEPLYLVKLNFVAYLTALNSLVTGEEKNADANIYENLPRNSSGKLFNVILRSANIIKLVKPEKPNDEDQTENASTIKPEIEKSPEFAAPFTADVGINAERRRTGEIQSTFVREIGDLSVERGFEEFDVSKYYLIPKNGDLKLGSSGELLFYKKTRKINWKDVNLTDKFKPDAVFSNGKFTKPLK